MMTVYDFTGSGNGYKVCLLMMQLGLPFKRVECDILKGETRTPEFLKKNPNGRIPTLELEDGTFLCESDAILWYLARGTRFVPDDAYDQARALQWMFFEQYDHEPNIAVARFLLEYMPNPERYADRMPGLHERGHEALAVMETHLAGGCDYFAGSRLSIADFALYGYTHVAGEGGFDLDRYPAVQAWIARVASEPGHILITA